MEVMLGIHRDEIEGRDTNFLQNKMAESIYQGIEVMENGEPHLDTSKYLYEFEEIKHIATGGYSEVSISINIYRI